MAVPALGFGASLALNTGRIGGATLDRPVFFFTSVTAQPGGGGGTGNRPSPGDRLTVTMSTTLRSNSACGGLPANPNITGDATGVTINLVDGGAGAPDRLQIATQGNDCAGLVFATYDLGSGAYLATGQAVVPFTNSTVGLNPAANAVLLTLGQVTNGNQARVQPVGGPTVVTARPDPALRDTNNAAVSAASTAASTAGVMF